MATLMEPRHNPSSYLRWSFQRTRGYCPPRTWDFALPGTNAATPCMRERPEKSQQRRAQLIAELFGTLHDKDLPSCSYIKSSEHLLHDSILLYSNTHMSLASPLIAPVVVPYAIPYIAEFKEFRL